MTSILGLDCSKSVGRSYFASPDAKPLCATWKARDSWSSAEYGGYFSEFEEWLLGEISVFKPDVLAFESPILVAGVPGRGTDEQQVRRLVGVVSVAEKVAYNLKLRCYEIHNQTAKAFSGVPGRRPPGMSVADYKNLMVVAMTRLGYSVADSHQADSCAISRVVYSDLGEDT